VVEYRDMYAKFLEDWFRHSNVNRGDTHIDRHRQKGDLINLLLFFFKIRNVS
jgi:hypothetical protein